MAELVIRQAVGADFAAIKNLIHEVGINPTGLDWRRFIVVEAFGRQFAGCGQLKPHSDGSIEMASIAVLPSWRGQGIARLIIQKLLESAPRPLYLTCRSQLGVFYQKFGFCIANDEQLPKYFRRISRIGGLMNSLHVINDKLLVMVLNQ